MGTGVRCKPGDLAIFVSGRPENLGVLVQVIRAWNGPERDWWVETLSTAWGEFKGAVRPFPPGTEAGARDKDLRPLRKRRGPDETLRSVAVGHVGMC